MKNNDTKYISIVPSERQLAYQQLEFYSFIHFTVNTFTGKEWGDGTENEAIFNPTKFDAKQWVDSIKSAGMTGIILTCKHHDGFCLWPSKYTNHTIKKSPYKSGDGDIVKEVSDACKDAGLKFGVYLSPWDRNNADYGYSDIYNDFFINQLTELLTNYGEVFTVWFDGACGEGTNGKQQIYDWDRYYALIRKLQPNACINVCGPDIRWCGNEAGDTRPSEWSVVPKRLSECERIQENSQQTNNAEFRERKIRSTDLDLGSRTVLENETDLIWFPAEVNTSIRPGWFYHEDEDNQVRSLDELLHIYYNSVGGNGTFLLNVPPTKDGLIHEKDVQRLKEIGEYLKKTFAHNFAENAVFSSDTDDGINKIENVKYDNYKHYFKTSDGQTTVTINIVLPEEKSVSHIVLKENIKLSQRIESFEVDVLMNDTYNTIFKGTIVGYKKIIKLNPIKTNQIRIRIKDSRVAPTLSFIGVY